MTFPESAWPRMRIGNVMVDLLDRDSALALIFDAVSAAHPLAVVSANLDHLHHFADDPAWAELPAVSGHDDAGRLRWLTLLDGAPLVRKASALSGHRWPKLSGSDLIRPIVESAAARELRVGFLGGTPATHARLRESLSEQLPALQVAGMWAPLRPELTDRAASQRIAADINQADVDILVVGLGKPRQEEWIARFGLATGAHVLLAFGASIDFLAGCVRRAPQLVVDAGAEWAWRLMLEPRRLSRRYLLEGPAALRQLHRSTMVAAQ